MTTYKAIDTDNSGRNVIGKGETYREALIDALRMMDLPEGNDTFEAWADELIAKDAVSEAGITVEEVK